MLHHRRVHYGIEAAQSIGIGEYHRRYQRTVDMPVAHGTGMYLLVEAAVYGAVAVDYGPGSRIGVVDVHAHAGEHAAHHRLAGTDAAGDCDYGGAFHRFSIMYSTESDASCTFENAGDTSTRRMRMLRECAERSILR